MRALRLTLAGLAAGSLACAFSPTGFQYEAAVELARAGAHDDALAALDEIAASQPGGPHARMAQVRSLHLLQAKAAQAYAAGDFAGAAALHDTLLAASADGSDTLSREVSRGLAWTAHYRDHTADGAVDGAIEPLVALIESPDVSEALGAQGVSWLCGQHTAFPAWTACLSPDPDVTAVGLDEARQRQADAERACEIVQPLGDQCGIEVASALAGNAALPALRRNVYAAEVADAARVERETIQYRRWLDNAGRTCANAEGRREAIELKMAALAARNNMSAAMRLSYTEADLADTVRAKLEVVKGMKLEIDRQGWPEEAKAAMHARADEWLKECD